MELRLYNDEEARRVARNFFKNEYHDPGIQKWGGFRTGHWEANLQPSTDKQKNSN